MKRDFFFLAALVSASAVFAADNAQQAFVKAWEGRTVTVKSTLYSLIFNERGKLGTTRSGLREGLLVATPSDGAYLQFDGRQGRDEVILRDPHQMVAAVNDEYVPDDLDTRPYRKIEAVAINQFDPGVSLVVRDVRVDRDEVTFEFATPDGDEPVTAIRVKWPVPLSKGFSERTLVEGLVQRFVELAQR